MYLCLPSHSMCYRSSFIQFYVNVIVKSWWNYLRLHLTIFPLGGTDGTAETLKIRESKEKEMYLQKVGHYFRRSS